jgi:hypothetical protein
LLPTRGRNAAFCLAGMGDAVGECLNASPETAQTEEVDVEGRSQQTRCARSSTDRAGLGNPNVAGSKPVDYALLATNALCLSSTDENA